MEVAGYTVRSFIPEYLWLDGGAMFGSVPKTLWSKLIAPDELNRIRLSCRVLYLEGHGRRILIDVGAGRKWSEKEKSIYNFEYNGLPIEELVPDPTDVILTHLHFDHGGGITKREGRDVVLTYPQATVYLQERHWEHARTLGVRDQASFIAENIEPLKHAKLIVTSDGYEILPNIRVHRIDGHTHGQQWIQIGSGLDTICFVADLIPTASHIRAPYVMGYDLSAEKAIEEKKAFLEKAVSERWLVVFEHDPEVEAAYVSLDAQGRHSVQQSTRIA